MTEPIHYSPITKSEIRTLIGQELRENGEQLPPEEFYLYSRVLDDLPITISRGEVLKRRLVSKLERFAAKFVEGIIRPPWLFPPHG